MLHKTELFTIWIFIVLAVSLLLLESGLRLFGYQSWEYKATHADRESFNDLDLRRGWRNKSGSYKFPGYSKDVREIYLSIDELGSRFTTSHNVDSSIRVGLAGGSWIHGWALSDHQTLAWKLQKKFPETKFYNFGSGGYGTYQSYLAIEDAISQYNLNFDIVMYGFMGHHVERNVAAAGWQKSLAISSKDQHVSVPYCEMDGDGDLLCHEPEHYPRWWFREHSALINLLNDIYARIMDGQRLGDMRPVTESLFKKFNDFVESNGGQYIVILFSNSQTAPDYNYEDFLKNNDIKYIDCAFPLTEDFKVKGEGHPNEKMNDMWLECVTPVLQTAINDLKIK